ncbi:hypothetical protein Patl1_08245 [Pistacia atlantica]|uniref:Uncharacterized protein n=1 Tax=Pistacia atlantica TaxID=434234 RepID=A0ACC1AH00_9ROSI|nr:hypothetical protein Patl1_08245 [Pistacia atlantica]
MSVKKLIFVQIVQSVSSLFHCCCLRSSFAVETSKKNGCFKMEK